jgi:hypothetical protein
MGKHEKNASSCFLESRQQVYVYKFAAPWFSCLSKIFFFIFLEGMRGTITAV